ncbi:MAG: YfhO family protein, partial [Actinomycetota bacterium]|nr:YfhO family protein [Actinomycetota bacterium]
LAIFAGASVAALALAAVALLPRLELVSRSTAASGVIDPAGYGQLAWSDTRVLFGWFGPHTAELAPLYAGALTPALALVALVRHWQAARLPLALAVLAIAWAAGLAGVIGDPIDPLRTITEHQSVRALPLFALALAALAGLALGKPGARPAPWLVGAFALAIALVIDPGVLVHGTYVIPALAALAVLVLLRSPRIPAVLACALVPAVLAADLARHDYSQQNPHQPAANWSPASVTFPQAPATARFLLQQRTAEGPSRFAWLVDDFTRRKQLRFVRGSDHADLLLGMSGTRFGLEDVAGYDPLQLATYHNAVASSNGRQPSDRHFTWVERAPTRLLRRLGVRYYVASPGLEPAGMTVVLRTPQATVVRDDKALPLARVNRPGRTDPARILVRDPDRVVISTPPGPAGRLVLADPPYPGWSVTVDGHSAPVRDQDGLFRAVDLPAGRHTVEWRFAPRSVKVGLYVTLAALLAAVAYAVFARRRSARLA